MSTQKFSVIGMTCESCEMKVNALIEQIPGVNSAKSNRLSNSVEIDANRNILLHEINAVMSDYPKYLVSEMPNHSNSEPLQLETPATYKPIYLIAAFISGTALFTSFKEHEFVLENFEMTVFLQNLMTGFFLVFSFFKLLNVKEFASSFAMYDIIGARSKWYALSYPFLELGIGILCLLHFQLFWVYIFEILIMAIGLIGVLQSILNKKKIQCACLGTVFNLPMSTVTVIENSVMIVTGILLIFLET